MGLGLSADPRSLVAPPKGGPADLYLNSAMCIQPLGCAWNLSGFSRPLGSLGFFEVLEMAARVRSQTQRCSNLTLELARPRWGAGMWPLVPARLRSGTQNWQLEPGRAGRHG